MINDPSTAIKSYVSVEHIDTDYTQTQTDTATLKARNGVYF